jgi:hypothetical protein
LASGIDRLPRACYRGSRTEIPARISSTTSRGTSSMPCSWRACTKTCWRISSSDSPWKVAHHPGTSTPHLNSFTSDLRLWRENTRSPVRVRRPSASLRLPSRASPGQPRGRGNRAVEEHTPPSRETG